MGTLVFVCPTTGHDVSTGVEVDRSTTKDCRERRRRSFVRAVARTICCQGFGLGWSARFQKCRIKASPRRLRRSALRLNDPVQFTSLFVCQAPRSCEELRLRELGPRIVFAR